MIPDEETVRERLQSVASRPNRYEQGETVYGVASFRYHEDDEAFPWGGKLFSERERAEEFLEQDSPLRDPDIHDTVFYRAVVAVTDSQAGRDTVVVAPDEETEIILTDVEILERRPPESG